MAAAANNMNGFNIAKEHCEDPWFQDVRRCVEGKIYYLRYFFDPPDMVPKMIKYIGPRIDPQKNKEVHMFASYPEVLIAGQRYGVGLPAVLDESCLREVPGQEDIGDQPPERVNEENNGNLPPQGPGEGGMNFGNLPQQAPGEGGMNFGINQAGGKRKRKTNRKRKSRKGGNARKNRSRKANRKH